MIALRGTLCDAVLGSDNPDTLKEGEMGPSSRRRWLSSSLAGAASLLACHRSATLWADESVDTAESENAEARAILEGIEKTRLAAKPFRVTGRHSVRGVRDDEAWKPFLAEHDGGRFRVRVTTPNGSTKISDGRQILQYDGESSATITSLGKPDSDLGFDPLLVGLMSWFDAHSTREDYLSFRGRKNLRIVSRRTEDDVATVAVSLLDPYEQVRRLWVQPARAFRVVRSEIELPLSRPGIPSFYMTTSEFRPEDKTGWFPRRVVIAHAPGGQVRTLSTAEFDEPEWGVEIPPSTWTLTGLDLPVGEPVADLRIRRRIGYWNGTGLQDDLPRKAK